MRGCTLENCIPFCFSFLFFFYSSQRCFVSVKRLWFLNAISTCWHSDCELLKPARKKQNKPCQRGGSVAPLNSTSSAMKEAIVRAPRRIYGRRRWLRPLRRWATPKWGAERTLFAAPLSQCLPLDGGADAFASQIRANGVYGAGL